MKPGDVRSAARGHHCVHRVAVPSSFAAKILGRLSWRIPTTYGWIPPIADLDWRGNAHTVLDHAIKEALAQQKEKVFATLLEMAA